VLDAAACGGGAGVPSLLLQLHLTAAVGIRDSYVFYSSQVRPPAGGGVGQDRWVGQVVRSDGLVYNTGSRGVSGVREQCKVLLC